MKSFKFVIDGHKYDTTVNEVEGNMAEVTVNGTLFKVQIEKEEKTDAAPIRRAATPAAAQPKAQAAGQQTVKSPLPGSIVKVLVKEGDTVKRGDILLTMESMKMENNIASEFDGTVTSVLVAPGQNVMQDDKLMEIATVAQTAAPQPQAPKAEPAPQPAAPQPTPQPAPQAPAAGTKVVSPLPGSVVKVNVTLGQAVKKGDTLITLESMKMENAIQAEQDGTVSQIAVQAGQTVMQDDLLIVLN